MFQKKLNEKVRGTYKNHILYTYSIFFVSMIKTYVYNIYIYTYYIFFFLLEVSLKTHIFPRAPCLLPLPPIEAHGHGSRNPTGGNGSNEPSVWDPRDGWDGGDISWSHLIKDYPPGINISHLGIAIFGGYVSFLEGINQRIFFGFWDLIFLSSWQALLKDY